MRSALAGQNGDMLESPAIQKILLASPSSVSGQQHGVCEKSKVLFTWVSGGFFECTNGESREEHHRDSRENSGRFLRCVRDARLTDRDRATTTATGLVVFGPTSES